MRCTGTLRFILYYGVGYFRSARKIEFYENTTVKDITDASGYEALRILGGVSMVFNNTCTGDAGTGCTYSYGDYRSDSGGGTILAYWDFEETGIPAGATTSYTINWDDTTSPSPLSGEESTEIPINGMVANLTWTTSSPDTYIAFEMAIDETQGISSLSFINFRDISDNNLCQFQLRATSGDIRILINGTTLATLTNPLTDATKHCFKIRINRVDGAGGDTFELYHSANGVWGEAVSSLSGLSFSADVKNIYIVSALSPWNIDRITVSNGDIGDY